MKVLENNIVRLEVLTLHNYKLIEHIALEKNLIQYSPSDISTPASFKKYVETACDDFKQEKAIPFIVYDKRSEAYAGCTRFGNIDTINKVLHIGWTWLGRSFQGTGLNKQIKFLMLEHAFEALNFEKVEFRIDERNMRSRKAVEKIGGKLEGILRENIIMKDGFRRNSCCYGILKKEWPFIKKHLNLQKFP